MRLGTIRDGSPDGALVLVSQDGRIARTGTTLLALIMDEGETIVRAGDIVIQRGTNHGWANRSDANCRIVFVLIDGKFDADLA